MTQKPNPADIDAFLDTTVLDDDVQCTQTGSGIQHQSFGAGGDQVAARLPGAGGNPSTAAENRHPHG
jgi:hypothetical protein